MRQKQVASASVDSSDLHSSVSPCLRSAEMLVKTNGGQTNEGKDARTTRCASMNFAANRVPEWSCAGGYRDARLSRAGRPRLAQKKVPPGVCGFHAHLAG